MLFTAEGNMKMYCLNVTFAYVSNVHNVTQNLLYKSTNIFYLIIVPPILLLFLYNFTSVNLYIFLKYYFPYFRIKYILHCWHFFRYSLVCLTYPVVPSVPRAFYSTFNISCCFRWANVIPRDFCSNSYVLFFNFPTYL